MASPALSGWRAKAAGTEAEMIVTSTFSYALIYNGQGWLTHGHVAVTCAGKLYSSNPSAALRLRPEDPGARANLQRLRVALGAAKSP